jgi:hypothetical protein
MFRTQYMETRDTIIQLYGLALCFIAIGLIDYSKVVKRFSGLKGFIPRSFLLFFASHDQNQSPMEGQLLSSGQSQQSYNDSQGQRCCCESGMAIALNGYNAANGYNANGL